VVNLGGTEEWIGQLGVHGDDGRVLGELFQVGDVASEETGDRAVDEAGDGVLVTDDVLTIALRGPVEKVDQREEQRDQAGKRQ